MRMDSSGRPLKLDRCVTLRYSLLRTRYPPRDLANSHRSHPTAENVRRVALSGHQAALGSRLLAPLIAAGGGLRSRCVFRQRGRPSGSGEAFPMLRAGGLGEEASCWSGHVARSPGRPDLWPSLGSEVFARGGLEGAVDDV
jgi:hypothetical protein